jgi:hypothetical protein
MVKSCSGCVARGYCTAERPDRNNCPEFFLDKTIEQVKRSGRR